MEPPTPITDQIPQLAPDIPASAFAEDNLLMAIIVALATMALLALFGYALWASWRRKRAAAPPPSPEAIALSAIDRLEEELPPLRPCALRLSLILRTFLAGQTLDTALYETHEEFSHRIDSLASLPEACQYDMRCLLETLAEQKYTAAAARDNPTFSRQLISQARELVKRITTTQAQEAAARDKE